MGQDQDVGQPCQWETFPCVPQYDSCDDGGSNFKQPGWIVMRTDPGPDEGGAEGGDP